MLVDSSLRGVDRIAMQQLEACGPVIETFEESGAVSDEGLVRSPAPLGKSHDHRDVAWAVRVRVADG